MPRLDAKDQIGVREIARSLEVVRDGEIALAAVLPALSELLSAPLMAAYGVELTKDGFALGFLHARGAPANIGCAFSRWIGRLEQRAGFNAFTRPDPAERNRVLPFPPWCDLLASGAFRRTSQNDIDAGTECFRTVGIAHDHKLRALICDGPHLLAWVGCMRPEPFSAVEQRRLGALVPALVRRLRLERRLEMAAVDLAALPAALERLPALGLVVRGGAVLDANTRARAWLATGRHHESWSSPRFERVPLASPGLPPCELVIERPAADPGPRLGVIAARWGLSPRQRAVFAYLARGEANKTIAARLGCAESTVELHVTALLQRAQVGSRAALVARLWSEPCD